MKKEISGDSKYTFSIKTIVTFIVFISTLIGFYYSMSKEIEIAKTLPVPEVSRLEIEMRDASVREAVFQTQQDVQELKIMVRELQKNSYK